MFNYNYIQFHKGLRVKISETSEKFKKRYEHYTPAMKMQSMAFALQESTYPHNHQKEITHQDMRDTNADECTMPVI